MPRMDLMVDTNVYFIHFKCGSKVLVDETKKKEFLDLFLRCYLNDKFRIFAFSVLDREIVSAGRMDRGRRCIGQQSGRC